MPEKPLIVRVLMARDWYEAYRLVLDEAYAKEAIRRSVAFDHSPMWIERPGDDRSAWSRARLTCLLQADEAEKAGDAELAGAWSLLGADPRGPQRRSLSGGRTYVPALREIGRVIVADPALLDEEKFCQAVEGWRFVEAAGSSGEDDLIDAAQDYGAFGKIDKEAMLVWAKMWSEGEI